MSEKLKPDKYSNKFYKRFTPKQSVHDLIMRKGIEQYAREHIISIAEIYCYCKFFDFSQLEFEAARKIQIDRLKRQIKGR